MTAAPDIFLSYSREDQVRAKLFAEAFEREGFSVWWDVGLRAGEAYDTVTENALKMAKAVVVLWSKRSVESRWVRAEATLADRNKTLVPAMIEACERPIMFELTHTAELMHWQGNTADAAFQAFLGDVRQFAFRDGKLLEDATSLKALRTVDGGSDLTGIALSPFALHSRVPGDDLFAYNLADEVVYVLSSRRTLRVVASGPSLPGATTVDGTLASFPSPGIRYAVKGSVGRTETGIRVGVQFLDASSGAVLWAQRFDRATRDPMSVLDELSATIVGHLDAQIERCEDQRVSLSGERLTLDARLRRIRIKRNTWRLEESLADAEQAVSVAPHAARAHAALAASCGVLFSVGVCEDNLKQRALQHGNKALKIDGLDRDVVCDVSMAFINTGDAPRGVGMLQRALTAAPEDTDTIFSLIIGYFVLGQLGDARAAVAAFRHRRPFSSLLPNLYMWETMIEIRAGDLAAARKLAEDGLRGSVIHPPQLMYHALVCARLGEDTRARASLQRARVIGGRRFSLDQILRSFNIFFSDPAVVASLGADLSRLWAEVDAMESP